MSSSAAQSNSGANIAANTTRLRRKAGQSTSANLSDGGGLLNVLNGRDASGGSSSSSSASAPTLSIGASSSSSGATGGGVGTGAHLSATPGYSSAHVPRSDVVGYMPLRGDFDLEYDNDAEVVIADMDFQEGEHTTETELKLKILEIYNAKLDERERRKSFVIERGLLDYKRLLAIERRRPRDEREIYDAFRPFARFNTPQEHEDLVRGVILEQRLRKRIAQLQEYRRNGIRSLAEAHEYDVLKRKRDLTSSSSSAAAAIATKKQATSSSSSSFLDRKSGGAAISATGSGGGGGGESQHATVAPASATDEKGRRSSAVGGKRKREESSSSSSAAASSKAPFVVAGLPGANLLSDKEKSLCEALRLVPSQYQQIKATVVNIALARGYVKRSDAAGKLVHIDAAKIGGVYDFVVSCGWAAAPQLDEIEKTC
jgi:transcriptional adapter 2-alpha